MAFYQTMIREALARDGQIGKYKAHHVEAWMRLEHSTLDGLGGLAGFRNAVRDATACIDEAGSADSEKLAKSFGLREEAP